ncbi:TetR family transcriptional regulator [Kribbella sp. NPDC050124]|uniref:TetR family transcriptional regulator n=1 Tax=Kribbella sp. NPDC050124 TaxID=3364114 RepID=UPI0037AF75F9
MSRYGYGNLALEQVAADAGYTRGALYHLFKSGRLGALYLAAILPFRYVLVYPPLLKGIGKSWATTLGKVA